MKKKGIYFIFIILLCIYCLLSYKAGKKKQEEAIVLYTGAVVSDHIKISDARAEEKVPDDVYDPLSVGEYLRQQNPFVPVIMIENRKKGYKFCLENGQYYRMKKGDRLFYRCAEEIEVHTLGIRADKKEIDKANDLWEVEIDWESPGFVRADLSGEIVCYRKCQQKEEIYITYF